MTIRTARTGDNVPAVLTVDEVAQRLRLNRRTVLRRAADGTLPAVRLGKLYRFDAAKLDAMFEQREVPRARHESQDAGHGGKQSAAVALRDGAV